MAGGSRTALQALYERHAPWLVVRLRRRCADATIVHDTIQDTFVAVWQGAAGYSGSGAVAAWIWGIGVRRLVGSGTRVVEPRTGPACPADLDGWDRTPSPHR
ncbi:MAG: hypothetical protein HYR89_04125 [Actinobacteria bacterium]|nr:hypothetical protein [Actinomycetota bacterium]